MNIQRLFFTLGVAFGASALADLMVLQGINYWMFIVGVTAVVAPLPLLVHLLKERVEVPVQSGNRAQRRAQPIQRKHQPNTQIKYKYRGKR